MGFGHVGLIVVVLSVLSSLLLPLGGSVVWLITTGDDGLDSGGGPDSFVSSVKVGFGHVGLVVAVLSVLSSLLLPLGGSVVWSIVTGDDGLDSGGGPETGPCRLGHWLQGNASFKMFASQCGKLPDRDETREE